MNNELRHPLTDLTAGSLLRLRDGEGRAVVVFGGQVWITLEDDTLRELARMADRFSTGVHIHVAEDTCDEDFCAEQHQMALIDRLANGGLMLSAAIFVAHETLNSRSASRRARWSV